MLESCWGLCSPVPHIQHKYIIGSSNFFGHSTGRKNRLNSPISLWNHHVIIKTARTGSVDTLPQNYQFRSLIQNWKIHKNPKSITLLSIQIYDFLQITKNQYENFTNFVPPVKFSYWFSFSFYGFGILYIFQIFCALAKSHSARFSISCSFQSFFWSTSYNV